MTVMINYGFDNSGCDDNDNNNICAYKEYWKRVKKTIYCNIDTLSCQLMSGCYSLWKYLLDDASVASYWSVAD